MRLGALAGGYTRRAGLLTCACIPVQGATLDGLVDRAHEATVLGLGGIAVALLGERFQATKVGLDRRGVFAVLQTLALGAEDALLLGCDVGHVKGRLRPKQPAGARRAAPYYSAPCL